MTDRAQGLAALCSAKLIATYPSIGIDPTLGELARVPDCPTVVVGSSERAAGFIAEGFAATSGQQAMVLVDRYWEHGVEPSLIPGAWVDLASVQDHRVQIRTSFGSDNLSASSAASTLPTEGGHRFAVVLPPRFHEERGDAESWVRKSGMGAVTTSSFDSFPRSDRDLWLGRVGFMTSPSLLDPASGAGPDFRWVLLGGSELAPTVPGERIFVSSLQELEVLKAGAKSIDLQPAASKGEDFASPLPKILLDLAERVPTSIAVADAGAAHRAVALALANEGHECLMTDVLTPMGWSLPAALGASIAHPGRPLLIVIGDGSALGSVTDLALLAAHKVPAIVVVARNGTLGSRTGKVRAQDPVGLDLPKVDWEGLCASIDIPAMAHRPGDRSQLDDVVAHLEAVGGPQVVLVDCAIGLPEELAGPTGIPTVDDHFRSQSDAAGGN